MISFNWIIVIIWPSVFSIKPIHDSSIRRIRKGRNYLISKVNFGKSTLLLRKNKVNRANETSRAKGSEHGVILSADQRNGTLKLF